MGDPAVTEQELEALRGVFALFDTDGTGEIDSAEFATILSKIGRDPSEAAVMLKDVDPDMSGKISFEEFVKLLNKSRGTPSEEADPKVTEFLRILEEYRVKCEAEGNYLEAGRASDQLDTLRKQEERRQTKALRARHLSELQEIQIAHNMQYAEFNSSWDKYMQEYDQMAQMYIQQMTDRHAQKLREFQEELHAELTKKPAKYSKELLDWRRREQVLAKAKKYAEAEKLKRTADELELREKARIDEERLLVFQQKEAKFRAQQQAELAALLKRIEGRRKEHLKQRELDSKRLLQRNRNVQAVLESKQLVEAERKKTEIKSALAPPRRAAEREKIDTGLSGSSSGRKLKTKKSFGKTGETEEEG